MGCPPHYVDSKSIEVSQLAQTIVSQHPRLEEVQLLLSSSYYHLTDKMSASISKILIIGATSGLGEAFAKHFHSQGKTVIAAGRRVERLNNLKTQLSGLETVRIDVEDINSLEANLNTIIKAHPDLDSVFVMSGKMEFSNFTDPSTSTSKSIISEATTNFITPLLIARTIIPHFLSLKRPTTFINVSSGLGYIQYNFGRYTMQRKQESILSRLF
jgi:short-subunit dehydrogenase involved in D-alanine esterification of teichoic acids